MFINIFVYSVLLLFIAMLGETTLLMRLAMFVYISCLCTQLGLLMWGFVSLHYAFLGPSPLDLPPPTGLLI